LISCMNNSKGQNESNKHFNILKTLPFPTVKVVNLKQFKAILDF
jgi:hypothetical protein